MFGPSGDENLKASSFLGCFVVSDKNDGSELCTTVLHDKRLYLSLNVHISRTARVYSVVCSINMVLNVHRNHKAY